MFAQAGHSKCVRESGGIYADCDIGYFLGYLGYKTYLGHKKKIKGKRSRQKAGIWRGLVTLTGMFSDMGDIKSIVI